MIRAASWCAVGGTNGSWASTPRAGCKNTSATIAAAVMRFRPTPSR
jgi:hypothetical protein